MDNKQVAQVFAEIADLLEIKGENAFKIRAYRTAADTLAAWGDPVARMDEPQLRELPGIGKDLAAKIRELSASGTCLYHQELLQEFPPTILDLLRLQGVGPKTVALLYSSLNITTVEELAEAARTGRLRDLKGMGAKKEALILKAVEERQKDAGRHLLADTASVSAELVGYLRERAPDVDFIPVGSLRRGCETCGDIDILAVGGDPALMEAFLAYPGVERVLGQGDTKSSVRLRGGYQADLRLVPIESRGAAMQYFTGSKAHNIALRDRAIQHGCKLNEYGLFRTDDDSRVAGETEEAIYEAARNGMDRSRAARASRRNRGGAGAAAAAARSRKPTSAATFTCTRRRPTAATISSRWPPPLTGSGTATSPSPTTARRWRWPMGSTSIARSSMPRRVRSLNGRFDGLTLLAGIECDILADGRLDLADDCLAQLDLVVASVHSHFSQDIRR